MWQRLLTCGRHATATISIPAFFTVITHAIATALTFATAYTFTSTLALTSVA